MSTRLSQFKAFIVKEIANFPAVQYLVNISESAIVVWVADSVIEPMIVAVLAHFKHNCLRLNILNEVPN